MPVCNGFTCGDGSCVNGTRCDGVAQCADGSDEFRCERQSSRCLTDLRCTKSLQFICTPASSPDYGRMKFPANYWCDNITHCLDKSDELNCEPCNCCSSSSNFYTSGSTCMVCAKQCDGNPECYNKADEQNCPTGTSIRSVAIYYNYTFWILCMHASFMEHPQGDNEW